MTIFYVLCQEMRFKGYVILKLGKVSFVNEKR